LAFFKARFCASCFGRDSDGLLFQTGTIFLGTNQFDDPILKSKQKQTDNIMAARSYKPSEVINGCIEEFGPYMDSWPKDDRKLVEKAIEGNEFAKIVFETQSLSAVGYFFSEMGK